MADPQAGAAATPPDPILEPAERAFDRGDWRAARAIARRELASADEGSRRAARAFLDRLGPDRQLLAVYAVALLAFAAVTWTFFHR